MTIQLVPLCTMTAELRRPFVLRGTPSGDRLVYEVASGVIEGERLRAKLCGQAAADWFTIGPDGTGTLDVRVLVETDDGAHVFIQYLGRTDTTVTGAPIYSTPRFETGDDRYRWLNTVQAVGKGSLAENGTTLTYEICEVR
jgi:hypothetical protein